jgi:hypothetical protein
MFSNMKPGRPGFLREDLSAFPGHLITGEDSRALRLKGILMAELNCFGNGQNPSPPLLENYDQAWLREPSACRAWAYNSAAAFPAALGRMKTGLTLDISG